MNKFRFKKKCDTFPKSFQLTKNRWEKIHGKLGQGITELLNKQKNNHIKYSEIEDALFDNFNALQDKKYFKDCSEIIAAAAIVYEFLIRMQNMKVSNE